MSLFQKVIDRMEYYKSKDMEYEFDILEEAYHELEEMKREDPEGFSDDTVKQHLEGLHRSIFDCNPDPRNDDWSKLDLEVYEYFVPSLKSYDPYVMVEPGIYKYKEGYRPYELE